MANNRIFYACQAVGFSPFQTVADYTAARGVQQVGVNTKFNLEQIFELGQLAIYENIEAIPDVEVTLEKCLDGYPLLYHLGTQGAAASTLVARSNQRCHLTLGIFPDTNSTASGGQLTQAIMSGMYVSQVSYDMTVQGPSRESASFVGNNKIWLTNGFTFTGFTATHDVSSYSPAAASGVQQRQDFVMASSLFPASVRGITSSGTNPETSSIFAASVQSVKVSANLGRDQLFELGRKGPYFRYVNFPVEVTTAIEIIAKDGDLINCYEEQDSTTEETMRFKMNEGLAIDLGSKNRLQSVTYGGGNAGSRGGNATITYSYTTFNDFDVRHPADPAGFAPLF